MPLAQHVVLKIVVAQRDGSDQRWGVAVKKIKGGRYLSLARGIPVVVPF